MKTYRICTYEVVDGEQGGLVDIVEFSSELDLTADTGKNVFHLVRDCEVQIAAKSNASPIGFCEICQKSTDTQIHGGVEVCRQHVSEADWNDRIADEEGERWADEREGNGYPSGSIGAATR